MVIPSNTKPSFQFSNPIIKFINLLNKYKMEINFYLIQNINCPDNFQIIWKSCNEVI